MLLDFERDGALPQTVDICIVGGGLAGLVIAAELARSGRRVLVLEAGGGRDEERSQRLFAGEIVGRPHAGLTEGRFRLLGGSSTRWGGQLLPLESRDFVARAGITGAGWPIGEGEVAARLDRAAAYLGVEHIDPGHSAARRRGRLLPDWNADLIQPRWSTWAPWRRRNIAHILRRQIADHRSLQVALHANVVEITAASAATGGNTGVRVRSYDGREVILAARFCVVACGAIETARLLLASRGSSPALARNGVIGRYFIDHLSVRAGRMFPADRKTFMSAFQPFFDGPSLRTPKLQLASALQEHCGSLAAQGHVVFDLDPTSAIGAARSMLQTRQRGGAVSFEHLTAVGRALPDVVEGLGARIFLGVRPVPAKSTPFLQIDIEQQPQAESHVRLGRRRDVLDMPVAVVDWRWGEAERRAARLCASTVGDELARLGLGTLDPKPGFADGDDAAFDLGVRDIYHQAGMARMGTDPKTSVVDTDLKVHGAGNLYVAGCAVMPTIGCGNPTLTMMALSIRLAEHLNDRLAHAA